MTRTADPRAAGPDEVTWPTIPSAAWRRGIGVPPERLPRPRVAEPMIDDGPWTGLPIGGLGAGSIGRTYRGDFRRWHLTIGEHRVESVPFAAFSVVVLGRDPGAGPGAGPAAEADSGAGAGAAPGFVPRWATVLSAARPDDPRGWAWELRPGDGTYHALMPRAWFEYRPDGAPIRIVEEQLAPLIPGDYEASALPVGVVTFTVENPTAEPLTVGVMLSWPDILAREKGVGGPSEQRVVPTVGPGREGVGGDAGDGREGVGGDGGDGAGADPAGGGRQPLAIGAHTGARGGPAPSTVEHDVSSPPIGAHTGARGVGVELLAPLAGPDGMPASFAILADPGPTGEASARAGVPLDEAAGLWTDFVADARLDGTVGPGGSESLAAVAVRLELAPGARGRVRFAIAWDLPFGLFGDRVRLARRYTRRYGTDGRSALTIAETALAEADRWRAAIEAWQAPFLADPKRPEWYVRALFNELYYLLDGGTIWTDDGPDGIGRFALLECYDYPFYATLDVDFYASWALLRLWPALERAVVEAFAATVDAADPEPVTILATGARTVRKRAGALPHDLGGPDEAPFGRPNRYTFQDVNGWKDLNSKFVLRLWRDAVATGDLDLARTHWPAVRSALDDLARADRDGDGLPEHDGVPDQTYDTWPMAGPSAYGGSLWLAALEAGRRIAELAGDRAAADRYATLAARGRASFEGRLWRGTHYAFDGTETETVMADQLVGQWYADATGLGDLVDAERIETALRTVHRLNVRSFAGGAFGPVNGIFPDGRVDRSCEQSQEVWVGTGYALAAFMIGRGLVAEGWETARGVAAVTYERGLWFRTPEAYDEAGDFRASLYLRPLAIWAIEEALERRDGGVRPDQRPGSSG